MLTPPVGAGGAAAAVVGAESVPAEVVPVADDPEVAVVEPEESVVPDVGEGADPAVEPGEGDVVVRFVGGVEAALFAIEPPPQAVKAIWRLTSNATAKTYRRGLRWTAERRNIFVLLAESTVQDETGA